MRKDTDAVREKIITLAQQDRWRPTNHAYRRCGERQVLLDDIRSVLLNPTLVKMQNGDVFRVEGLDLDGIELALIAEVLDYILIITVY